jgi:lipoate-protein ligase A
MALDAAIAWGVGEGLAPPTLRLYRWEPAAVSLGYAQQRAAPVNLAACARAGLAVVRRPTGGRAVLHLGDLTYAVAVPRRGPWADRSVAATCRAFHEAVAAGLRRLGVPVEVSGRRPPGSGGPFCFATVSSHEITVHGRKLVGSAQRRFRRAILQHGSVQLILDRNLLAALASQGSGMDAAGLGATTCLAEILGGPPDPEVVGAALVAGFAARFGVRFAALGLASAEATLARRLEAAFAAESTTPARMAETLAFSIP